MNATRVTHLSRLQVRTSTSLASNRRTAFPAACTWLARIRKREARTQKNRKPGSRKSRRATCCCPTAACRWTAACCPSSATTTAWTRCRLTRRRRRPRTRVWCSPVDWPPVSRMPPDRSSSARYCTAPTSWSARFSWPPRCSYTLCCPSSASPSTRATWWRTPSVCSCHTPRSQPPRSSAGCSTIAHALLPVNYDCRYL